MRQLAGKRALRAEGRVPTHGIIEVVDGVCRKHPGLRLADEPTLWLIGQQCGFVGLQVPKQLSATALS